jgi:hypothetical protein
MHRLDIGNETCRATAHSTCSTRKAIDYLGMQRHPTGCFRLRDARGASQLTNFITVPLPRQLHLRRNSLADVCRRHSPAFTSTTNMRSAFLQHCVFGYFSRPRPLGPPATKKNAARHNAGRNVSAEIAATLYQGPGPEQGRGGSGAQIECGSSSRYPGKQTISPRVLCILLIETTASMYIHFLVNRRTTDEYFPLSRLRQFLTPPHPPSPSRAD